MGFLRIVVVAIVFITTNIIACALHNPRLYVPIQLLSPAQEKIQISNPIYAVLEDSVEAAPIVFQATNAIRFLRNFIHNVSQILPLTNLPN